MLSVFFCIRNSEPCIKKWQQEEYQSKYSNEIVYSVDLGSAGLTSNKRMWFKMLKTCLWSVKTLLVRILRVWWRIQTVNLGLVSSYGLLLYNFRFWIREKLSTSQRFGLMVPARVPNSSWSPEERRFLNKFICESVALLKTDEDKWEHFSQFSELINKCLAVHLLLDLKNR